MLCTLYYIYIYIETIYHVPYTVVSWALNNRHSQAGPGKTSGAAKRKQAKAQAAEARAAEAGPGPGPAVPGQAEAGEAPPGWIGDLLSARLACC